jgi:large subunit ribosomal protein L30
MVKKKVEKKVIITQLKSTISQTLRQKRTIVALGLGKINRSVEK